MLNTGRTPAASNDYDWVIDERGFAAILQNDELERDLTGIIGGPRVNPTGSGLWIEDAFPAAMNQITIALLANVMRIETSGDRFATLGEFDAHSAASDDVTRSARAPTRCEQEPGALRGEIIRFDPSGARREAIRDLPSSAPRPAGAAITELLGPRECAHL